MNINQLITPTNATNAIGLAGGALGANGPAKNVADRDTFLTLLVAQLKNQDPLSPMEGAEFVAQLAQFNSLEQLININDRLSQLVNQNRQPAQTAAGDGATV